MKRNMLLLAFIGICFLGILCYARSHGDRSGETGAIMVGGLPASYESIDRELDINYFYGLARGTTYQEIEEEIGRPNGGRGSGLVRSYYQVGEQYVVMDFSLDEEGGYDELSGMSLYSGEEYLGEIPLK